MAHTTLRDVIVAVADQIRTDLAAVSDLSFQVEPRFVLAPSELVTDIYPSLGLSNDLQFAGFADSVGGELVTVRTRVPTAALDDSYDILLDMMDDETDVSIIAAIMGDRTLGGVAQDLSPNSRSGFVPYPDLSGEANWLGFEWSLTVVKARS